MCGCYGRSPRLIPESKMQDYQAAGQDASTAFPAAQDGHEQDWVRACKGGKPASSNFDFSGPLSEMVLMGNLAVRYPQPQTALGRREDGSDQRRRSQRLRPPAVPPGLEPLLMSALRLETPTKKRKNVATPAWDGDEPVEWLLATSSSSPAIVIRSIISASFFRLARQRIEVVDALPLPHLLGLPTGRDGLCRHKTFTRSNNTPLTVAWAGKTATEGPFPETPAASRDDPESLAFHPVVFRGDVASWCVAFAAYAESSLQRRRVKLQQARGKIDVQGPVLCIRPSIAIAPAN